MNTRNGFIALAILALATLIILFSVTTTRTAITKQLSTYWKKPVPWKTHTIRQGDSLASLFLKNHLSYNDLKQILALPTAKAQLEHLIPGETLAFQISKPHKLLGLKFAINPISSLHITKQNDRYNAVYIKKELVPHIEFGSATINTSLNEAAIHAKLPPTVYEGLTKLFSGEINFTHNIQKGDRFNVLYQEYFLDGKPFHAGKILAATFSNHGKTYQAFRFTYPKNHTGYYTANGDAVQSLFIFPPLHYKYISSYFTYHRMDPILHVVRPHLGIDFAAHKGTPIKTIGTGHIIFAGKDDGYGNAVLIRYSHKYKALYGHMMHFARGIHSGAHVTRGQIIGYVGDTGWSTGPHLHFELYVYGVPHNPLKMKFPNQHPVPQQYLEAFKNQVQQLQTKMNAHENKAT